MDFVINSGKVFVCGLNLDDDPKTIKGNIGVVPQENIDPFFTPIEIMNIQSACTKQYVMCQFSNSKILGFRRKSQSLLKKFVRRYEKKTYGRKAMVHNPPLLI